MIKNIRKWIKDKAGVSPIIAIILMVAITVVLAATIYVWVSGMGKSGGSTPAISMSWDPMLKHLSVTGADTGIKWANIQVVSDLTAGTDYKNYTSDGTEIHIGLSSETHYVTAGDYIDVTTSTTGTHYIKLIYKPTNSEIGKWTFAI